MAVTQSTDQKSNGVEEQPDVSQDLQDRYSEFRKYFIRLLSHRGVDASSGTAIAAALGLNRQLAWRLATIAGEPRCSAGLQVLPGAKGLRILVSAARRLTDTSPDLGVAISRSVDELEAGISYHAGDRASLGLLTVGLDTLGFESRSEALRRDGYRAQSALLGLRTKYQIRGGLAVPSKSGAKETLSYAHYTCFAGLVRLRPDRPSILAYAEPPWFEKEGFAIPDGGVEAHFREKHTLLREVSSLDEDQFSTVVDGYKAWLTLQAGPIGRHGAETLAFTGSGPIEFERFRSESNKFFSFSLYSCVPTDTLYLDLWMHRSLKEHQDLRRIAQACCTNAATGVPYKPPLQTDPRYLFELEDVATLEPSSLQHDAGMPGLDKVVAEAAEQAGVRADDLVGIRFTTRYVMSPVAFVLNWLLPSGPAG